MGDFFPGTSLEAGIGSFRVFNLLPEHLFNKLVMADPHGARPKKIACLKAGDFMFLSSTRPKRALPEHAPYLGHIVGLTRIVRITTGHVGKWPVRFCFKPGRVYRLESWRTATFVGVNSILDNPYSLACKPELRAEVIQLIYKYAQAEYDEAPWAWPNASK